MGLFSHYTEDDAFKQIDKINCEIRAINASMHLNGGFVDDSNKNKVLGHFYNIARYAKKYDKIKRSLSEMERVLLMGATVDVWNGEKVGVLMWEHYFRNTIEYLDHQINHTYNGIL